MKKIKITLLALTVLASIGGALATKKARGGQQFFAAPSQPSIANEPIATAQDQSDPPSIECTSAMAPYVCTIATKSSAPFYNPGDNIPRTQLVIIQFY